MKVESCDTERRHRDDFRATAPDWAVGRVHQCTNNYCLCNITIEEDDIGHHAVRLNYTHPYEAFSFRCPRCNKHVAVFYYPDEKEAAVKEKAWWQRL